jgi:hypothetical protein
MYVYPSKKVNNTIYNTVIYSEINKIIGSWIVIRNWRFIAPLIRLNSAIFSMSISERKRLSPVILRRWLPFHFKRSGEYVSGWKRMIKTRMAPDMIRMIHAVQRQERTPV